MKIARHAAVLLVLGGAAGLAMGPQGAPPAAPDLTARDAALLREAAHLQATLGTAVWPDWHPARVPLLYLAGDRAWLIDHPAPPEGFTSVRSSALGRDVLVRARGDDEGALRACYPIEGHPTVVIAAPDDDAEAFQWTLVCAHEMFHCYQGNERHIDPFTGDYAALHELSYPFPYDEEDVRAAMRLEAELVHRLATLPADGSPDGTERVPARLLQQCATVDRAVMADERHLLFKQWEEWKEGVAKYVERELSRAAADSARYTPHAEFAALFPADGYAAVWSEHYEGQLGPVRFVGEGVRGRIMFYYLGLGKAVALDRLMPGWKDRYRETTLDELLLEAAR